MEIKEIKAKERNITSQLPTVVSWSAGLRSMKTNDFFIADIVLRAGISSTISIIKNEFKDKGIDVDFKTKRISKKEFKVTRIK